MLMFQRLSVHRVKAGLLVTLLVASLACSKPGELTAEQQQKQREELERKTQQELATKYNASLDWHEGLEHFRAFSLEVENALIRPNAQPVVFIAYLEDVMKREDKYFARFHWLENPKIYFILECKPELAQRMLSQPGRIFPSYAVVAVVSTVVKAALEVNARALTHEETELEIDTPDVFIARGNCLEAQFVR